MNFIGFFYSDKICTNFYVSISVGFAQFTPGQQLVDLQDVQLTPWVGRLCPHILIFWVRERLELLLYPFLPCVPLYGSKNWQIALFLV